MVCSDRTVGLFTGVAKTVCTAELTSVADIRQCGHRVNHRPASVGFVTEKSRQGHFTFGFTNQYDSASVCGHSTITDIVPIDKVSDTIVKETVVLFLGINITTL